MTILPDGNTIALIDFPVHRKTHEAVYLRPDGTYLILLDAHLNHEMLLKKYTHALEHIRSGDFERCDVQQIENEAHRFTNR